VLSIEELLENIVTPKPGSSTVRMKDLVQPATDIAQMGMNMGQVIQIMDKKNTRFLPVVDTNNKYLGFVTKNGIFNKYRKLLIRRSDLL
ncbi:MAG: CBS domain-containing protein, partial [Chitinophagaceae bacterium]|nr:CBS domain-containing protein [Chitinophagaceae bacterium]